MIEVALATEAELPALLALDPVARRSEDKRTAITEWVAAGQCHVAFLEGRPAGYVAFTRSFFRSPFIEMLMVAEDARRRGVGRALMQHCVAMVPHDVKLWTSTNQSNLPMQALLPTLGFVRTGIFEHLDEGDPELIYLRWSGLPA
jgi:ribosomal protein S18 acetylase RimI-like enzyme